MKRLDCTRLSPAEQDAGIRQLAAEHDAFEIRGWRAAERNLDFIAVWLARLLFGGPCAGYLAQGGIEGTVARALHLPFSGWRITGRTVSFGGAQTTLRAEKCSEAQKTLDSSAGLN